MEKVYVIQSLVNQGYWSEYNEEFKGILFTTHYPTEKAAVTAIVKWELKNVEIKAIYI